MTTFKKPSGRCRRCRVKYRQHASGLCRSCEASRFNPSNDPGTAQSIRGWNGLHGEATNSWWVGHDREAFAKQRAEEQDRMARSSVAHALKPEVLDHAGW